MKLNQELLDKIQDGVAINNQYVSWSGTPNSLQRILFPEVVRIYSEQIIKCDMCNGNGEYEGHHDTLGDCPMICSFCEGEGYLKD